MSPLALLAAGLLGVAPVECPAGAELRGAAPTDGYEQWCEAPDRLGLWRRHGPSRTWWDDGAIRVEQRYALGELDGPFLERHRGGHEAREGAFRAGKKVGRWTIWFESGRIEEESTWRDGVMDGPYTLYWPSGRIRVAGRYCGGAQCGRWKTFDEDGREVGVAEFSEQSLAP